MTWEVWSCPRCGVEGFRADDDGGWCGSCEDWTAGESPQATARRVLTAYGMGDDPRLLGWLDDAQGQGWWAPALTALAVGWVWARRGVRHAPGEFPPTEPPSTEAPPTC